MKTTKVEIREVTTKEELRRFIDYPNVLYRDVEQYIPSFYSDDLDDWNRDKNPAFSYCEAKCFLALRDDEIVGRIGAILSHKANQTWNTRRMRFTQVDFIDDREVSAALFAAVEDWARSKGCTQIHGPLGFCDLDREGMLIEGFDRKSMFITYYNHPYYIEHMNRLGYGKGYYDRFLSVFVLRNPIAKKTTLTPKNTINRISCMFPSRHSSQFWKST